MVSAAGAAAAATAATAASPSRRVRPGAAGLRDRAPGTADGGPGAGREGRAARRGRGSGWAAPPGRGSAGPRLHARSLAAGPRPPRPAPRGGEGADRGGPGRGTAPGGVLTEGVAWDPIFTLERVATLASAPQPAGGSRLASGGRAGLQGLVRRVTAPGGGWGPRARAHRSEPSRLGGARGDLLEGTGARSRIRTSSRTPGVRRPVLAEKHLKNPELPHTHPRHLPPPLVGKETRGAFLSSGRGHGWERGTC